MEESKVVLSSMDEEDSKEQLFYDDVQHDCFDDSLDKSAGRWTKMEHELFLEGLERHKKQWKAIAELVKTRTVVQVRTHAQKYFQKLKKSEMLKGKKILSDSDYSIKSSKCNGGIKKSFKSSIIKTVSCSDDGFSRMTSESCLLTSSSSSSSSNTSYGGSEDGDISETDRGELIDILCFQQEQSSGFNLKRSRDLYERQASELFQQNLSTITFDFNEPTNGDKIELYECLYGVDLGTTDTEGDLDNIISFWPDDIEPKDSNELSDSIESEKDIQCNFLNMIDDLNINLGEDINTIFKVDDNSTLFDSFHRERTLSAQFEDPSFIIPFSSDNRQPILKSLSVDTCLSTEVPYFQPVYNQFNSNYFFRNNQGFPVAAMSYDQYDDSHSSFVTPKGIAAIPSNLNRTANTSHFNNSSISPVCKKRGRPRKDSDAMSMRSLSKNSSSENLKAIANVPIPTAKPENPLILILKRNNSNNALNLLTHERVDLCPVVPPAKILNEEELFVSGMLEAFE